MIYSTDNTSTSITYPYGYPDWDATNTSVTTSTIDVVYPNWLKYVTYVPPGGDLDFTADDFAKLKPKTPRISPKLYMEVEKEMKFLDVIAEAELILKEN